MYLRPLNAYPGGDVNGLVVDDRSIGIPSSYKKYDLMILSESILDSEV